MGGLMVFFGSLIRRIPCNYFSMKPTMTRSTSRVRPLICVYKSTMSVKGTLNSLMQLLFCFSYLPSDLNSAEYDGSCSKYRTFFPMKFALKLVSCYTFVFPSKLLCFSTFIVYLVCCDLMRARMKSLIFACLLCRMIGQAALEQKNCWMVLDSSSGKCKFYGGQLQDQEKELKDDCELSCQFSSGIKTVGVIPVESRGVLQLGSIKEISEDPVFIEQAKKLIQETDSYGVSTLSDNACSIQDRYAVDENELFPPMIPSQNSFYSDPSLIYNDPEENLNPSCGPVASSMPCVDMLCFDGFTSSTEQEDCSPMLTPNLADLFTIWSNEVQNIPDDMFYPHCWDIKDQGSSTGLVGDLVFDSSVLITGKRHEDGPSSSQLFGECQTKDFDSSLLSSFPVDTSQWLNPLPELCITWLDDETAHSPLNDLDVGSISSSQTDLLERSAICAQSLIANAFDSCGERKFFNFPDTRHQLFHGFGMNFTSQDPTLCENNRLGIGVDVSKCKMKVEGTTKLENWETLLSQVCLEQLLDVTPTASCVTDASIPNQSPLNKRIRLESFSSRSNHIPTVSHAWTVNSRQPLDHPRRANDFGSFKDNQHKSEFGSRSDDCYGMNNKSCNSSSQRMRNQEPGKPNKKRAERGEGNKLRPKDRQLIQDRMLELREIVPGGAKQQCSQVQLLGKALDHLVFLQSVIDYVKKVKSVNKSTGQKENALQQQNSNCNNNSGVTWALEVGDQHTFFPIRVKDLGHHGLMGIEMLCEDHGFFLEIADLIRKLDLIILKGVMEVQQDNICASFIVEVFIVQQDTTYAVFIVN
ncbi:hypothetical protein Dimus_030312 [Dionaea muscipula]